MSKPLDLVASYCITDDILKFLGVKSDPRAKLADSEIIIIGIYAAFYSGGNHEKAMYQLKEAGHINNTIDKSRLSRRLHLLSFVLPTIFSAIRELWINAVCERTFIVDSTPIPTCDNIRIERQRLCGDDIKRGYQASFHRYFFGIKVQMVTTSNGVPVDYIITSGNVHDSKAFKSMELNLPQESILLGDSAYGDASYQQTLWDELAIVLKTPSKSNSKKKKDDTSEKIINAGRKRIESMFSSLKGLFPRKIHATTFNGFLLKIEYFILTFQLHNSTHLLAT